MTEEKVFIDCEDFSLEALLDERPGERALIMCHPHPLYGGEMRNQVVEAVTQAYGEKGHTTLRFNFRGVGRSGGSHGEGMEERGDVRAALNYLRQRGKTDIDLGGYSFGAWVCARWIDQFEEARRLVMVSPPVSAMDMSFMGRQPKLKLVIAGSRDEIGSLSIIEGMIPTWNREAALTVIDGADHFFLGKKREITAAVLAFLETE